MTSETDDNDKNTVTIFVVHSNGDEEDDDWFPNSDEVTPFQPIPTKNHNLRKKSEKKKKIPVSKRFKINKGKPVKSLSDLIDALNHEEADENQKELLTALKELNEMIGMEQLKNEIVNQLLFFMQDLQEPGMFLHTVLTGPPGSGKTSVVNILAKIYSKMGVLDSNKVVKADRAALIGKWLGSTAIKTKEVLDSARGGVLLLDEVYSLGNKEGGDSFAKECIDTINQYLSEHADELICVIAGYKDKVQECFFNYNPGLDRRFPWRFAIDSYKVEDLYKIMKLQLKRNNWTLDESVTDEYLNNIIQTNKNLFKGNGGDTQNFIDKCKICHARRSFTLDHPLKRRRRGRKQNEQSSYKCLNREDIEAGLGSFRDSKMAKEIEDKYEKLFLVHYLHDSWTRSEVDIDITKLYNKYEDFMYKNNYGRSGGTKMLGMVEFVKKICDFKGVNQDTHKMQVDINIEELFEFLKLAGVVTEDMRYNKRASKFEKTFLALFFHDSWKKGKINVEPYNIYNSYEEFMSKNREKKMLGMIEFIKKICEFEGIDQDTFKTKIVVHPSVLFEYLKKHNIITFEIDDYKQPNNMMYQ